MLRKGSVLLPMTSKQVNDWVNVSPIDQWAESRAGSAIIERMMDSFEELSGIRTLTQTSPLTFQGNGWLALMRDGKPVALKRARQFETDPEWAMWSIEHWEHDTRRDYWKPVDDKTADLYRCSLEVIE